MKSRKLILYFVFLLLSSSFVFASEATQKPVDAAIEYLADNADETQGVSIIKGEDNLLLANVPISYGEEEFIERIKKRTGDDRESIGLVLSGGSARAFAHIGVLKYLEEIGFVPDFIISNSMGSIIALLYGAGLSPDQIANIFNNISIGSLFDLTIPINQGILVADQMKSFLDGFIPEDTKIENLTIPVMVVEEDLITKRQIHVMEGDLGDVLIASFALPFYFGSSEYNGHLIIDGGIANLVPLDLAYQYAPFNVVSTTFYDNSSINLKNPLTALNTSIDIGKRRQGVIDILKHKDTAIWIRCNVESISFMEFSALNELIAEGYKNAKTIFEARGIDNLNCIPHSGVTEDLIEKRKNYDQIIKKQQKTYSYYNHIYMEDFSVRLGLGLDTFGYKNDSYYLRDDVILGLRYGFRFKDWDLSVLAGISLNNSFESKNANPTININQNYYLFDILRLSMDLSVIWNGSQGDDYLKTSFYFNQQAEYKAFLGDKAQLLLRETWEKIANQNENSAIQWDGNGNLITLQADFKFNNKKKIILGGSTGLNLLTWEKGEMRTFTFGKANIDYRLGESNYHFTNSLTLRYALDEKGDVPFFYSDDQFRTYDSDLRNQGSPSSSLVNPDNFLISFSSGISWKPSFMKDFSFGELLLLKDNLISIYLDSLWAGIINDVSQSLIIPVFATGIEFSSTISLIGLKSIPLIIDLGWDQLNNGLFLSIKVGKKF
ncbi:MAG: patatin-like phospholipase family protein [Sphaerochaetaceae bacterium]|nr:patatin-like phospholipase family protein [Sphaerochaetaceae bacterium]